MCTNGTSCIQEIFSCLFLCLLFYCFECNIFETKGMMSNVNEISCTRGGIVNGNVEKGIEKSLAVRGRSFTLCEAFCR